MKVLIGFKNLVLRGVWRLLSVPIYIKILGIGGLVAIIFGGLTFFHVYATTSDLLYGILKRSTWKLTRSLAANLERPMLTGDFMSVVQRIRDNRDASPEIRYVVVRTPEGRIAAHTFHKAVPRDLTRIFPHDLPSEGRLAALSSGGEHILDCCFPILKGLGGSLQLGISDRVIRAELSTLTRSVLWTGIVCAVVGSCLALGLTHILTRPIHNLVDGANRIRTGDFRTRVHLFSDDEIGKLALAFNQMAESLERYAAEIREKERVRVSLIDRIVRTQEEERRTLSRELHDHLGQSLSALLLTIQSGCGDTVVSEGFRAKIEQKIRALITETQQLAWGMRPTILDDYGLNHALQRYVNEVSAATDIQIDYQYSCSEGEPRLPLDIEVALYRVAQEAVTNIMRHAGATQASIVFLQERREVRLLIEDNGCGIDCETARGGTGTGLGLTGMEERIDLLAGSFAVESAPRKGTTIRITIPLNEKRRENQDPPG